MKTLINCFFILGCKCFSFKTLQQQDEDDPSNLTVAVKHCHTEDVQNKHVHARAQQASESKERKKDACFKLAVRYVICFMQYTE